ncbi:MAG: glycosyltransferase [Spirochaetia bacterium]|jgi:1,2-diacylglycerol 3-alpha-glucosyltransferase|nr:glycosyltransferase [Spirochaetia bacterium]
MKVLITTDMYFPEETGVAEVIRTQARGLRKLGHDARILTISECKKSFYDTSGNVYRLRAAKLKPYKDSWLSINYIDSLIRDIIEWKPDIIHSQCEFFTMNFAKKIAAETGCKIIHTCHTDFPAYADYFIRNRKIWKTIVPNVIRYQLKTVELVITPSEKNAQMLKNFEIDKPIKILPSGIDLEKFRQRLSIDEKKQLLKKYGLSPDDFILVSICRLTKEKNVQGTITDFSHIDIPGCKLLVVGDGDYKVRLGQQVQELGLSDSVRFVGAVPSAEVWKYYQLGSLFVSSSQSETQGLTYYEACASGVPIICKRDKCLEVLLEEGQNGYYFDDWKSFVRVVEECLDDSQHLAMMQQMAVASAEKFSEENFVKKLLAIYREYIRDGAS